MLKTLILATAFLLIALPASAVRFSPEKTSIEIADADIFIDFETSPQSLRNMTMLRVSDE